MTDIGRQSLNATVWGAVEIAARYGVQIVVTIVLARLLSPGDFGLIAMLLVFTNIGMVLADGGFATALIQRQHTTIDDESTVFWFNTLVGLIGVVLLWLGASAIAGFYHQPKLFNLTRTVAWVLLFGAVGAVPDALLTQKLAFKARARAQIISSLLSGATAILAALHGYGVWSLVLQALVASALRTACLWLFSHWRPRFLFSNRSFRRLFGFGGFMLLSGLLDTISTRLQALLIGRLFNADALGFYSLAQNVAQAPTSFIGTLLSRVGLPVFSQYASDRSRLRAALRVSLNLSLFLFLPCMVGLALAARPLIGAIYGARWEVAAPIASLLSLAGMLWPVHVLNLAALSAQGHSARFFYLEIIKNLIGIVAVLIAVRFGTIAVAAAVLAAGICSAVVNTWYSKRLLRYGALAQLYDQRSTLLLLVISALPAWAMLHWAPPNVASTLGAVLLAGSVYVGAAAVLRIAAWRQLLSIFDDIIHPRPAPTHTTGPR